MHELGALPSTIQGRRSAAPIADFFCSNVLHRTEHGMTTIGYARVSTDGQTLRAQTEALHAAGCARIFAEKISGAYSDRPQLAKAIAALGEGDTLVVCKLDRLARTTDLRPWIVDGNAPSSCMSVLDQLRVRS